MLVTFESVLIEYSGPIGVKVGHSNVVIRMLESPSREPGFKSSAVLKLGQFPLFHSAV